MNFQFFFESPSSLWGSYADWAMVLLTFVTAGALIWTLYEQIKINKQTLEKSRREIRPHFKVQFQKAGIYRGINMADHYVVSLNNAIASNVRWSVMLDNPYLNRQLPDFIRIWDLHHYGVHLHNLLANHFAGHDFVEVFQIDYQDEEMRDYFQKIVIDKGEVFTTFPRLVKDI